MNIDDPLVSRFVFHPRKEPWSYSSAAIATKTTSGDEKIGGYLHVNKSSRTLLLFFHGNGEIAADYDSLAPLYTRCGVSFWVVDYRGYGRSSGQPAFTAMFSDADAVLADVPRVAEAAGIAFDRILVMGRSLGSASAIYLAATASERIQALLLDSAFADGPALIRRIGGPDLSSADLHGFVDNLERIRSCALPVLIVHGTEDWIIPVSDAQALFDACPSLSKRLVKIQGAGHNDLLMVAPETYVEEIRSFLRK